MILQVILKEEPELKQKVKTPSSKQVNMVNACLQFRKWLLTTSKKSTGAQCTSHPLSAAAGDSGPANKKTKTLT